MNILTVDNITKSYGVRKIFDGASFFLQEGEKAGIIGINGTGKSTLLKMIAGLEEADDGTVIKANHCLVRYLPQNPEFAPEETVLEAVLRGNRVEENAGTIEADAKSMLTKTGCYGIRSALRAAVRRTAQASGTGIGTVVPGGDPVIGRAYQPSGQFHV